MTRKQVKTTTRRPAAPLIRVPIQFLRIIDRRVRLRNKELRAEHRAAGTLLLMKRWTRADELRLLATELQKQEG